MQTAEGAMTEVHSMLQRMRELSVQSANDTNTTSDRQEIQLEIDQLNVEIDSIANKTEFNTRKLLDGSSAADTQYIVGEMGKTNLKEVPRVIDASLKTGRYDVGVELPPVLTYNLNQPGAGVSDASVIDIQLEGMFQNNQKENTNLINPPKLTNPVDNTAGIDLAQNMGSYQVTIDSFTNVQSLVTTPIKTGIGDDNLRFTGSDNSLPLGEYSLTVSNYTEDASGDPLTADIEIKDSTGVLVGKKTQVDLTSPDPLEIGEGNRTVELDLGTIDSNGTDKITMSYDVQLKIEQINSDGTIGDEIEPLNVVALTTNAKGQIEYGGLTFDFAANSKVGTSKFDITTNLSLGEYTIVVSDYQATNSSATIEVFDPNGFSIGQKAAQVGENGTVQTIGDEDGKHVAIDTKLITQAGTAKVQIENKLMISVSKVETDQNGVQVGETVPITFQKEITTNNGILQHGA